MATITFEPAPDIVLENMTAQRKYVDGTLSAVRVFANEGYVIYDTAEEPYYEEVIDPETGEPVIDPETGEPVTRPVIQYFTMVTVPARFFDVETFTWVAVPRDSVPADQIFDLPNNDHVTA